MLKRAMSEDGRVQNKGTQGHSSAFFATILTFREGAAGAGTDKNILICMDTAFKISVLHGTRASIHAQPW